MDLRRCGLLFLCALVVAHRGHGAATPNGPAPDAMSANPRLPSISVRDVGAVGDGKAKDTQAIQHAIDTASQAGGGTVYLPPGTYLSGTLFLKSHVTLHLEAGAVLLGSTEISDYPKTVPRHRSYTDKYVYQSLLYGEDIRHVAIVGRGVIDGQGAHFPRKHPTRQYGERPYLIRLISCRKIQVRGITLRNSAMWVQHYLACDDLVVDGVAVDSQVNANNDGIDIDGCHDVRIANCSVVSGDDAIVLKSTSDRICKNVTVTNCVLSTHCNGLKLGTESNGGFQNITMTNCALHDVRLAGVALEMVDGGVLDRITVSNIVMDNVGGAIFLRLGHRARPFTDDMPAPGMGQFRNVVISNIIANVSTPIGCAVAGLPDHPIENVSLCNIKITVPGGGEKKLATRAVPEHPADYPEYRMFGMLPAYGFYCRHLVDLTVRDIDLRWSKPDHRPAVVCDDVQRLRLVGCDAPSPPGGGPLLVLNDAHDVLLQGCVAPRQTGVFLRLQGTTDRVSILGNDWSGAATPVELAPGLPTTSYYQSGNHLGGR